VRSFLKAQELRTSNEKADTLQATVDALTSKFEEVVTRMAGDKTREQD